MPQRRPGIEWVGVPRLRALRAVLLGAGQAGLQSLRQTLRFVERHRAVVVQQIPQPSTQQIRGWLVGAFGTLRPERGLRQSKDQSAQRA